MGSADGKKGPPEKQVTGPPPPPVDACDPISPEEGGQPQATLEERQAVPVDVDSLVDVVPEDVVDPAGGGLNPWEARTPGLGVEARVALGIMQDLRRATQAQSGPPLSRVRLWWGLVAIVAAALLGAAAILWAWLG